MSKQDKIKLIIAAIINMIIFVLEVFCLIVFIKHLVDGNEDNRFRYYTNISNLFVGLVALINAIILLKAVVKGKLIYSKALSIIKFSGLSMICLTFFTVLFIIAPITSFQLMYSDVKFITHLVTPILAVISYLFLEEKEIFNWKLSLIGIVPTLIYAIVYIINVVFLTTWPDLYRINTYGLWFIFSPLEVLFGFGLSQGLYFLKKALIKKSNK